MSQRPSGAFGRAIAAFKERHTCASFFAIRTPLLSNSALAETVKPANGILCTEMPLDTWQVAMEVARGRMLSLVKRSEVREAIFLASPDLESQIDDWVNDPRANSRIERSLFRYLTRMSNRPTPFGLFAGCQVGEIAEDTSLSLEVSRRHHRVTRLDNQYLHNLCEALSSAPEIKNSLKYVPNSMLYVAGDRWHYIEAVNGVHEANYFLVGVDRSEEAAAVLDRAHEGTTADEMIATLFSMGVDRTEAATFVAEMIDAQLLVSTLMPRLTGGDALAGLIEQLAEITGCGEKVVLLRGVARALATLDEVGLGSPPSRYSEIASTLEPLGTALLLARLFQVDLVPQYKQATLGMNVVEEAGRAATFLGATAIPMDTLRPFCLAFREKYGDAEVPLVRALDAEVGIQGVGREGDGSVAALQRRRELALTSMLLRWQAAADGPLKLEVEDIEKLIVATALPLPDSFSLTVTIAAESAGHLVGDEFDLVSLGGYGPSTANLLGRFCHTAPEIERSVREVAGSEESVIPDAIYAEVVHLPSGRLGNVIARPILRQYEIPFYGRSGADLEHQIPVTDLLVSVVDGNVLLRSSRLGRRVIPRCSTAHNFADSKNLAIYTFLGWVARQGVTSWLDWTWGGLEEMPHLPRVVLGRTTLAREQWRIAPKELEGLSRMTRHRQFLEVQQLRLARGLPRMVMIVEGDNVLPFDLDSPISVDGFVALLGPSSGAKLVEVLPSHDQCAVAGEGGSYAHEIQIPFVRRASSIESQSSPFRAQRFNSADFHTPASEWLYAKIYVGRGNADRLLVGSIGPVMRRAIASGSAIEWYFLRYTDPDFHIRVRVRGDSDRLRTEVLPELEALARVGIENGVIARIGYDTYFPETSRYGGRECIPIAHSLFHIDSECALDLLEAYPGWAPWGARAELALLGIRQLMAALMPNETSIATMLRGHLSNVGSIRHQWGKEYRSKRARIERLLTRSLEAGDEIEVGLETILAHSHRTQSQCMKLRSRLDPVQVTPVLMSLVHMHINRLLRDSAPELTLLDFSRRFSEFASARGLDLGEKG